MLLAALGILTALSISVFATIGQTDWRAVVLFTAGLGVAAAVPAALLDPGFVAMIATAAAAHGLFRPRANGVQAAAAGFMCRIWSIILVDQGLTLPVAALPPLIVAGSAAVLARRSETFCSELLRDEALLAVATLGILVGAGPGVVAGYSTAVALRGVPLGDSGVPASTGALALAGLFVLVGGMTALWRNR